MITRITTIIVATFFSLNMLIAQQNVEVKKISLNEAISFAKQNNATLKNAKLDETLSKKSVNELLANGLPQANAELSYNHNIDIPVTPFPDFITPAIIGANKAYFNLDPTRPYIPGSPIPVAFGQKNSATASFTVGQLLFDGTFFLGVKAAKEYVKLSTLTLRKSEIDVETDITKAYYFVLINEERMTQVNKSIGLLEKSLSDMREIYKAGLGEKIDLDKLELSYSNAIIQREQLKDGISISYQILKMNMGAKMSDSIQLTEKLNDLSTQLSADYDLTGGEYNKRIEYQMAEQGLRLNKLDRKRYLTGYMPTITAFASLGRNTFATNFSDLGTNWYPSTIVGGKLSLPIFDGFRKHAQTQKASINIEKTENTKKYLETAIELERYNAKTTYLRTKNQVVVQKKNIELAEQIYSRAQLKLKEGVGSSTELLLAETDLKNAQTSYLSTMYDLMVAQLNVKKSIGY
ncbi:MAG: TolC family protein [Bacteroidia bacterium]